MQRRIPPRNLCLDENDNGEFLISQRAPNKSFPHMRECTGGNAIMGEGIFKTLELFTYIDELFEGI